MRDAGQRWMAWMEWLDVCRRRWVLLRVEVGMKIDGGSEWLGNVKRVHSWESSCRGRWTLLRYRETSLLHHIYSIN